MLTTPTVEASTTQIAGLVRLHPATRITPPSMVNGPSWTIDQMVVRRRIAVQPVVAAAVALASRPIAVDQLIDRLQDLGGGAAIEPAVAERLIHHLQELGFLIDAATGTDELGARTNWMLDVERQWRELGCVEAFEYTVLTYDYPCLDYSVGKTILEDRSRMREYQSIEPDADRMKLTYLNFPARELAPLADCTMRPHPAGSSDPIHADTLAGIVTMALGRTGEIKPITDAAPLIQRSSPSGGGRNPTEGYLFVREVDGLADGIHHVTMEPWSLRRIRQLDHSAFEQAFADRPVGESPLSAVFVLTSVFERNMYRYREARTFRSIHLDAGHIAGAAQLAATALGVGAEVLTDDDPHVIEQMIGLDGMVEGYMASVALFRSGPVATEGTEQ